MYIGETVSNFSKGRIPQMLIVSILFLLGFWTILPADFLERSYVNVLSKLVLSIIFIDIGASIELSALKKSKHILVISTFIVLAILFSTFILFLFNVKKDILLNILPSLTGAGIGALLMKEAAFLHGDSFNGTTAMAMFISHSFISFPLSLFILKKEAKRNLQNFKSLDIKKNKPDKSHVRNSNFFKTSTYYLVILFFLGTISEIIAKKMNFSSAIIQLIMGLVVKRVGILDRNPLIRSSSSGILNVALFASFMQPFSETSITDFFKILAFIIPINLFTVVLLLFAFKLLEKISKKNYYFIGSIGMNSLLGFPFNILLTQEAIRAVTNNSVDQKQLEQTMVPKMILASTFSVSFLTPFIATICIKLLYKN